MAKSTGEQIYDFLGKSREMSLLSSSTCTTIFLERD